VTITRHDIISALDEGLASDPNVIALWLEGADATHSVDEYSDIDVCCSVEAGTIAEILNQVREILESFGSMDLVENFETGEDHQHTVFHLAETSEYLLIDFNLFVGRGSTFVEGDELEKPLILFDKSAAIQYLTRKQYLATRSNVQRIQELRNTVAQSSRIDKYVKRGLFLEAYGYYHRWLLEPLVEILRMRYTPLHPEYYIVHISRHLPADVLARLEGLFQVNSVAEIEVKSREALLFFEETVTALQSGAADES